MNSRSSLLVVAATLLLLRSRLISSLPSLDGPRRLSQKELDDAQQQLYFDEPDGSKRLLVPHRGNIAEVRIRGTPLHQFAQDAKHFPLLEGHRPNVDRAFVRQLVAVLRIAFPSWRSKEVGIVLLHSTFLVLRTLLSVAVARLDGKIVRACKPGEL